VKDVVEAKFSAKSWAAAPEDSGAALKQFESLTCGLYKPGHLTHFIQIKVKFNLPRVPVSVELESTDSLRISMGDSTKVFYHHRATEVFVQSLEGGGVVEYSPEAKLLWFPVSSSRQPFPAYLSDEPLQPCERVDFESGYFFVPGKSGEDS
jgi:hypothetical protein